MKIKLTENKLKQIVAESVRRTLTEIAFSRVANTMGAVNDKLAGNQWTDVKINPKKTPEQIRAQQERITKQYNDLHGKKGEIEYDFKPNNMYADNFGEVGVLNAPRNDRGTSYIRTRNKPHNKVGGVTITGKNGEKERYTTGNAQDMVLYGKNPYQGNDNWYYYGSSYGESRPVALDSKGNPKTGDNFTQDQVNALNNLYDTYEKVKGGAFSNGYIKRGGRPFTAGNQMNEGLFDIFRKKQTPTKETPSKEK